MIIRKLIAWFWALLGLLVAIGTVGVSVYALKAQPMILQQPLGAEACVEELMDAVCGGDFERAQSVLYGTPDFGIHSEGDGIETKIWNAFVNSLEYETVGSCYAAESGIAMDVCVRSLDIPAVTTAMRQHAQDLLKERVEQAEDVSDVYDDNQNYRADFVNGILNDAAQKALNGANTPREQQIRLNLTFENGQWWVVPSQQLVNVLSGF